MLNILVNQLFQWRDSAFICNMYRVSSTYVCNFLFLQCLPVLLAWIVWWWILCQWNKPPWWKSTSSRFDSQSTLHHWWTLNWCLVWHLQELCFQQQVPHTFGQIPPYILLKDRDISYFNVAEEWCPTRDKGVKSRKVEIYQIHPYKEWFSTKFTCKIQCANNYCLYSLHPTHDDFVRNPIKCKPIYHSWGPLHDPRNSPNVVWNEAVRVDEGKSKGLVISCDGEDYHCDRNSCQEEQIELPPDRNILFVFIEFCFDLGPGPGLFFDRPLFRS